jgi:hypothetical protein
MQAGILILASLTGVFLSSLEIINILQQDFMKEEKRISQFLRILMNFKIANV